MLILSSRTAARKNASWTKVSLGRSALTLRTHITSELTVRAERFALANEHARKMTSANVLEETVIAQVNEKDLKRLRNLQVTW